MNDKAIIIFDIGDTLKQRISVYGVTLDEARQVLQKAIKQLAPPKPVTPYQAIDNVYPSEWEKFKLSQGAVDRVCNGVGEAMAGAITGDPRFKKPKPSKEMTDWFPPRIKPVRAGVYKVKHTVGDKEYYAMWHGRYWGLADYTVADCNDRALGDQSKSWRGFKESQE